MLEKVQAYFSCGYIVINKKRGSAEFVVNSIPKLQKLIIPHFKHHPLHYPKQLSFEILVWIVDILDKKAPYDKEVFAHMIKLAYSMNEVTNRTMAQEHLILRINRHSRRVFRKTTLTT